MNHRIHIVLRHVIPLAFPPEGCITSSKSPRLGDIVDDSNNYYDTDETFTTSNDDDNYNNEYDEDDDGDVAGNVPAHNDVDGSGSGDGEEKNASHTSIKTRRQ
jgi:hypothetical protein